MFIGMRRSKLHYYVSKSYEVFRDDGLEELYKSAINTLTPRVMLELQKIRLKYEYGGAAPSPYDLIYINPNEVKYCKYMRHRVMENLPHNINAKYGTFIIGGQWDKRVMHGEDSERHYSEIKFEDNYLWEATIEHFNNGTKWENTSAFRRTTKDVSWFQAIDEVYESIQSNGYKRQRELDNDISFIPPEYDEIRVNIGRDGEIFFDDGRHRFCAVKKLGIERIPVRVYVRHKKWQETRNEIYEYGFSEDHDDELRNHPDLVDVL